MDQEFGKPKPSRAVSWKFAVLTSPGAPANSGRQHCPLRRWQTDRTRLRLDPAHLLLRQLPPRPAHHGFCWLCHRGDRRDRTLRGCGAGSPVRSGLHQSRNYSRIRGRQNDVSGCQGQWRGGGRREPGGHSAVARGSRSPHSREGCPVSHRGGHRACCDSPAVTPPDLHRDPH